MEERTNWTLNKKKRKEKNMSRIANGKHKVTLKNQLYVLVVEAASLRRRPCGVPSAAVVCRRRHPEDCRR